MLARLSRSRGGEGLALLARLALAHYEAAAASPLLVRGGGGGGGGESDINVGDSSTTATMATSTSSAARSFRSSSSSSAQKRIDAKQTMKTSMTNRGPLSSSYSFSSRPLNRFQPHRKTSPSASPSYSTAAPSPRKLDDIMRLDSLTDKTGEEIASIWTEFHHDDSKNHVGGTLSAEAYRSFTEHISAAPMLVWPLRKEGAGGGAEEGGEKKEPTSGLLVLLSQAQLPHVLFTTVDEFRALGPDAPAHVVLTHYAELAEEKGVVLWRADVVSPALLVSSSTSSSSSSSKSRSSSAAASSSTLTEKEEETASLSPSSSTSSSDAARALVATTHALYADPEGRAHAKAFNEAKGFDFGALMNYFGLKT